MPVMIRKQVFDRAVATSYLLRKFTQVLFYSVQTIGQRHDDLSGCRLDMHFRRGYRNEILGICPTSPNKA